MRTSVQYLEPILGRSGWGREQLWQYKHVILVLSQEDPWGLLARQPRLLDSFRLRDPVSKNKVDGSREYLTSSSDLRLHACLRAHGPVHTYMCTLTHKNMHNTYKFYRPTWKI